MTKTQFEPSIASRPVYGELERVDGAEHLFICDSDGLSVVAECMKGATDDEWRRSQLIVVGNADADALSAIRKNPLKAFYSAPSFDAALPVIRERISAANGRTQLYLAGGETTIGRTSAVALEVGLARTSIQTEHRGSTKRRMQCVHCKGITEDVTHDPFQCSHCGLHLFVRDHYSRRHAAFQGVCVDAEDPGNIPKPIKRFS